MLILSIFIYYSTFIFSASADIGVEIIDVMSVTDNNNEIIVYIFFI